MGIQVPLHALYLLYQRKLGLLFDLRHVLLVVHQLLYLFDVHLLLRLG